MSDSDRILATYEVRSTPEEVAGLARRIAYEQTVELPPALVTDPVVCERVLGRVEAISPRAPAAGEVRPSPGTAAAATHRVTVSYSGELANGQLPQLLNLLYGNVSLYPDVRSIEVAENPWRLIISSAASSSLARVSVSVRGVIESGSSDGLY